MKKGTTRKSTRLTRQTTIPFEASPDDGVSRSNETQGNPARSGRKGTNRKQEVTKKRRRIASDEDTSWDEEEVQEEKQARKYSTRNQVRPTKSQRRTKKITEDEEEYIPAESEAGEDDTDSSGEEDQTTDLRWSMRRTSSKAARSIRKRRQTVYGARRSLAPYSHDEEESKLDKTKDSIAARDSDGTTSSSGDDDDVESDGDAGPTVYEPCGSKIDTVTQENLDHEHICWESPDKRSVFLPHNTRNFACLYMYSNELWKSGTLKDFSHLACTQIVNIILCGFFQLKNVLQPNNAEENRFNSRSRIVEATTSFPRAAA